MKYILLAAWIFISYTSIIVMLQLIADAHGPYEFIHIGAICTIWSTLIVIAGKFIYSCLKQNK